jgi:hypothetical protein
MTQWSAGQRTKVRHEDGGFKYRVLEVIVSFRQKRNRIPQIAPQRT